MDSLFIITAIIVILALSFDFINGFHDTANSIATSVSTRALKPRHAIILAASMNFLGAITFTGVAKRSLVTSLTRQHLNMVATSSSLP